MNDPILICFILGVAVVWVTVSTLWEFSARHRSNPHRIRYLARNLRQIKRELNREENQ